MSDDIVLSRSNRRSTIRRAPLVRTVLGALVVALVAGMRFSEPLLSGSPATATATATATADAIVLRAGKAIAFRGVTVVDVIGGRLLADQTVVIAGTRIRAVGPSGRVRIPPGAQVVDARGMYVIPGLWDMHFHVQAYPDVMYPLAIANGVTGVRDMNTAHFESLLRWRHEIVAGTRIGPRMVATAGYLGNEGEFDSQIKVTTPEQARRVVDSLKALGVDFIKTRDGLSREVYFAALAEARRIGIPLVGHLSKGVTLIEASDSGQRTIEHTGGTCDALTDSQCVALAAHLVRNGTWVTPTMVLPRYFFGGAAPERLRFWPDSVQGSFAGIQYGSRAADEAEATKKLMRAVRSGMPILAGTDAAPVFPENTAGFSLHEELAWFVAAGMSPLDALRTATRNPARYLRATDSLGAVAAGKVADLVMLDADPLADIHAIDRIRAVVANGRYFDRTALDSLLAGVERQGRGR